jgi:hypothetical protein
MHRCAIPTPRPVVWGCPRRRFGARPSRRAGPGPTVGVTGRCAGPVRYRERRLGVPTTVSDRLPRLPRVAAGATRRPPTQTGATRRPPTQTAGRICRNAEPGRHGAGRASCRRRGRGPFHVDRVRCSRGRGLFRVDRVRCSRGRGLFRVDRVRCRRGRGLTRVDRVRRHTEAGRCRAAPVTCLDQREPARPVGSPPAVPPSALRPGYPASGQGSAVMNKHRALRRRDVPWCARRPGPAVRSPRCRVRTGPASGHATPLRPDGPARVSPLPMGSRWSPCPLVDGMAGRMPTTSRPARSTRPAGARHRAIRSAGGRPRRTRPVAVLPTSAATALRTGPRAQLDVPVPGA